MSAVRQWIFIMTAILAMDPIPTNAQTASVRAAYMPEPIKEADWMRRVSLQQGMLNNQPCNVCFIGDSLTEFWLHTGSAMWTQDFMPLKPINLGITADRTEHILHRIQRLDFRRANPKVVVLLMGTNNLGMEPPDKPDDVARAISAGVAMLRAKLPEAQMVVLTIPPGGNKAEAALRARIKQTNALLSQTRWPDRVRLLPVYESMIDASGEWKPGLTLDGTHFSESGYAQLAEILVPVLKELLAPRAAVPPTLKQDASSNAKAAALPLGNRSSPRRPPHSPLSFSSTNSSFAAPRVTAFS